MRKLLFLLPLGLFAQTPVCIAPPGTTGAVILTACPATTPPTIGVALSTLPANSLAVALPNGNYLPVIVANPAAGTVAPAAATIVPFLDPVGNTYSIPVLAFTMIEGFAILQQPVPPVSALNAFPRGVIPLPSAINVSVGGNPPIVNCIANATSLRNDACTFLQ
jgi:hypothetical protein